MIREEVISVTTTGSDAAATGTGYSKAAIVGKILALRLNYHASAPGTTDVTITENDSVAQTIHTETDSATDVMRYPRRAVEDNAEATVEYSNNYSIYEPYVTTNQIKVAVSGSNALTACVVVSVIYEG